MQHHDHDEPGRVAGPCLIEGMSNAEYHGNKAAIGCSGLKQILDCPAIYYGQNRDPKRPEHDEKESASQLFGNSTHCILFEPDSFADRYRVGPAVHSKNLKIWQDFKKECEADGASAIDGDQYMAAMKIRESALALPDVREALLHPGGRGESSVFWNDPATGVLCKVRPDWRMPVGNDAVVLFDGKTFATGDTREFGRQVPRMNYHMQAAFYSDGYMAATGKQVLAFVFIVIADQYPYPVNTITLDDKAMAAGGRKYRRALDTYAECLKTGVWPGYAPGIKTISIPDYALED